MLVGDLYSYFFVRVTPMIVNRVQNAIVHTLINVGKLSSVIVFATQCFIYVSFIIDALVQIKFQIRIYLGICNEVFKQLNVNVLF